MTIRIGTPPVDATAAQLAQLRQDLGGTQYASLVLTSDANGKRQALGATVSVMFTTTANANTSIYTKFTDASGNISVTANDTTVNCNASTPVRMQVPSGLNFLEYLQMNAPLTFNLALFA